MENNQFLLKARQRLIAALRYGNEDWDDFTLICCAAVRIERLESEAQKLKLRLALLSSLEETDEDK